MRVRAAGLNRADLIMASGRMHGSAGGPGTVLGLEFAGEVEAVGSEVTGVKPGDRVMCSGNGGYAEYAVTDWGRVAPIPANNMSYEQAATLPVALQTMHNAVVTAGRLKAGETVLIQGASSGVGLMGLQIAKLKGARLVIGTSTNAGRRERLKEFGADLAIDTTEPEWSQKVLEATGGKGVDLIVDQVSASVANENMKAAAVLGRIVNVGRLGGFKGEFDFDLHALKRIDYIGVTFRTRSRRGGARDQRVACAPTCGAPSRAASSGCRSTASSRWTRPPPRWRTCAPTRTSARSCWWFEAREDCSEREPDHGRHPGAASARQRARARTLRMRAAPG